MRAGQRGECVVENCSGRSYIVKTQSQVDTFSSMSREHDATVVHWIARRSTAIESRNRESVMLATPLEEWQQAKVMIGLKDLRAPILGRIEGRSRPALDAFVYTQGGRARRFELAGHRKTCSASLMQLDRSSNLRRN